MAPKNTARKKSTERATVLEVGLRGGIAGLLGTVILMVGNWNNDHKQLVKSTQQLYAVLMRNTSQTATTYALELVIGLQEYVSEWPSVLLTDPKGTDFIVHVSKAMESLKQKIQIVNHKFVIPDAEKYYVAFLVQESFALQITDDILQKEFDAKSHRKDSRLYNVSLRHVVRFMSKYIQYILINAKKGNMSYDQVRENVLVVVHPGEMASRDTLYSLPVLAVPFSYPYYHPIIERDFVLFQQEILRGFLVRLMESAETDVLTRCFIDTSIYSVTSAYLNINTIEIFTTYCRNVSEEYARNKNIYSDHTISFQAAISAYHNVDRTYFMFSTLQNTVHTPTTGAMYEYIKTLYGNCWDMKPTTNAVIYVPKRTELKKGMPLYYEYIVIYKIVFDILELVATSKLLRLTYQQPYFPIDVIPPLNISELKVAIYYGLGRNVDRTTLRGDLDRVFLYILDYILYIILDEFGKTNNINWQGSEVVQLMVCMRWCISKKHYTTSLFDFENVVNLYWTCFVLVNSGYMSDVFSYNTLYTGMKSNTYELMCDIKVGYAEENQEYLGASTTLSFMCMSFTGECISLPSDSICNDHVKDHLILLIKTISLPYNEVPNQQRMEMVFEISRHHYGKPFLDFGKFEMSILDMAVERFKYMYLTTTKLKPHEFTFAFVNKIKGIRSMISNEEFAQFIYDSIKQTKSKNNSTSIGKYENKTKLSDTEYENSMKRADFETRKKAFGTLVDEFKRGSDYKSEFTKLMKDFLMYILADNVSVVIKQPGLDGSIKRGDIEQHKTSARAIVDAYMDEEDHAEAPRNDINRCKELYGILGLHNLHHDPEEKKAIVDKLKNKFKDIAVYFHMSENTRILVSSTRQEFEDGITMPDKREAMMDLYDGFARYLLETLHGCYRLIKNNKVDDASQRKRFLSRDSAVSDTTVELEQRIFDLLQDICRKIQNGEFTDETEGSELFWAAIPSVWDMFSDSLSTIKSKVDSILEEYMYRVILDIFNRVS